MDEEDKKKEIRYTRITIEVPEDRSEVLIEILKLYCTQITQIE